jgi:hypothetical protein
MENVIIKKEKRETSKETHLLVPGAEVKNE